MFGNVKRNPMLVVQNALFGRLIDKVYQEAYDKGYSNAKREIVQKLKHNFEERGLENFKSDELRLGYNYAKGITEDVMGRAI